MLIIFFYNTGSINTSSLNLRRGRKAADGFAALREMGRQGPYPRRGSSGLLNSCWSLCRWGRGHQGAAPPHLSLLIPGGTCPAVGRTMLKAWWMSQVSAEVPKKAGRWVTSTTADWRSIESQADLTCSWSLSAVVQHYIIFLQMTEILLKSCFWVLWNEVKPVSKIHITEEGRKKLK